jgi:hypothetical protein
MTNHAYLIAALRIPMNVTLPGAPELDEYDEQREAAEDAIEAVLAKAYRRGQEDMRERAADVLRDKWASTTAEHEEAIRSIPIKEKDDE